MHFHYFFKACSFKCLLIEFLSLFLVFISFARLFFYVFCKTFFFFFSNTLNTIARCCSSLRCTYYALLKKKKNYMHNFKDKFLIVFCGLLHIQVQRQKKNTFLLQISFFLSFLYTPTHTYIYVLFRIRPLRILYITIHLLDRVSFLFSNSFFPVFFFLVLAVFCDSFFFFFSWLLLSVCRKKKTKREKTLCCTAALL